MRPSNPACYTCPKGARGLHVWRRNDAGAICLCCELQLTGEDAADVFVGARTPIGEVRRDR